MTRRGTSKVSRQESLIEEAYRDHGRTLADLAKFHDCSKGTIRNVLNRRGVVLRRRGRKTGVRHVDPEVQSVSGGENPFRVL
jgi:hypothetical protein